MKMEEIWKDVDGYEGYYQVSNLGRVKSLHKDKEHILPQTIQNNGYLMVSISVNGKHCMKTVHRLVANAFIPNDDNKEEVNHKNGNKKDNNVSNLEWVTRSENIIHSYKNPNRRNNSKPIKCMETGVVYKSCKEASIATGICRSSINHAINGIYKHAGGYTWVRI